VKLREPFTYFVDRSLGRYDVVDALRAAGENAHAHDSHFDQNTPDVEWLAEVGKRRWVVLTKDKNLRRNELEHLTIVNAKVACFMLGRGDVTAATMGRVFVDSLPQMKRVLRRFHVPVAASLSVGGQMRVLLAKGTWLERPIDIRR
jgi:predicted nuclease of predicted toxin-antitoxin system